MLKFDTQITTDMPTYKQLNDRGLVAFSPIYGSEYDLMSDGFQMILRHHDVQYRYEQ